MKTTILYLMALMVFTACNSDESKPQSNDLIGQWKLVSFVNETNGTTVTASDFENSNEITIVFTEDLNYKGSTVRNEFSADYTLNSSISVLTLTEFFTTEVNETDWGNLFYDKMRLNYDLSTKLWHINYKLSNNVLKIYCSEKEYLEFEKK